MPIGSSDLSDAPIESEENTLQLQKAQTRTVNLEPLRRCRRPVEREAVSVNLTECQVKRSVHLDSLTGPPSARFMLSRASKRGPSFSATALKTDAPTYIHPDVAEVPHARKPAVAPGLTTATHGMSYPANLETAKSVERNIVISESIPAIVVPTDRRQNSSHTSPNDWQNARIKL